MEVPESNAHVEKSRPGGVPGSGRTNTRYTMTGHRQHGSDLPFNDIVRRHDKAMQYTSHWIQKQLPVYIKVRSESPVHDNPELFTEQDWTYIPIEQSAVHCLTVASNACQRLLPILHCEAMVIV